MTSTLNILRILPLIAALAACSLPTRASDEGAVDYAKAAWHEVHSCVPFVRRYESVCGGNFGASDGKMTGDKGSVDFTLTDPKTTITGTVTATLDARASKNVCEKLSAPQRPAVREGDIITVNLQQAYIDKVAPSVASRVLGRDSVAAAIVAHVAELDANSDFDFSRGGLTRGRVVYYSPDVKSGQFLNLSRLPIYGPTEYKGKPLVVELYIVQLNVSDQKEIGSLLNSLAGLGSISYPPASPVLKVLEEVGSALLKKTDVADTQMRYSMTLAPNGSGISMLKDAGLEYANYVVSRLPRDATDGKKSVSIWGDKYFSQKLGRVFADQGCSAYVNHTYLTLQVNRAGDEIALNTQNTFSRLMDQVSAEAGIKEAARKDLLALAGQAFAARTLYEDSRKLVDHAVAMRWPNRNEGEKEPAVPAQLDGPVKARLAALVDDIDAVLKPAPSKTPPPRFDTREANILLDRLRPLAATADQAKVSRHIFDAATVKTAIGAAP
jgi:hypothetical protein